jgi:hypothetical protein
MSVYEMTVPERDPYVRFGYSTRTYSLEEWARFPEVVLFADRNRISFGEAIMRLANSGLSHMQQPFEGYEIKYMTKQVEEGTV